MIVPIMLRSFGRSGSTLLMQVLGSSSNVIFDKDYPFEKRHLTYLHRLSKILDMEVSNGPDWNPDAIFKSSLDRVGPIPYQEVKIFERHILSKEVLKQLWAGFSKTIKSAVAENINQEQPVYYAEKVVHDICDDVNSICEAKNIFLFRDPRDEFLSVRSFNKKRGFNGFGWEESDDDISYARKLCAMRRNFMRHIAKIQRDDRRFFVKYEQFLSDPYGNTEDLSEWLGVSLDYAKVEEQVGSVSHHMTSRNVSESISRWKYELDGDVLEIFKRELGEELCLLGYEV